MSAFHNTALIGSSGQNTDIPIYAVSNSIRLRSGASGYFSRTPGSSGNRNIYTLSFWIKPTGTNGEIFAVTSGSGSGGTQEDNRLDLSLSSAGSFSFYELTSGSVQHRKTPTQLLRDNSAWYHAVVAIDYTQATGDNRIKMYINGSQVTSFSTNSTPTQNFTSYMNGSGNAHYIGGLIKQYNAFSDQYLTEFYFVDGQQLTASSFGQTDTITGQWVPKQYTGTYGTNGYYLRFADTTGITAATIGKDSSGNGNNWTPSGISNTTGVTYDFMTDSPTRTSSTAANYAVLNPGIRQYNTSTDFTSDGNLKFTVGANGGVTGTTYATIPMTSGKWYAEVYINAAVTAQWIGVSSDVPKAGLGTLGSGSARNPGYAYKVNTGNKCNNDNTGVAYAASSTTGDIIGIAMDADAGSITFYKNGTSLGVAYTGMTNTGNGWLFGSDSDPNGSFFWNFGQRPFTYTPPTGFVALNTYNLPAPAIKNGANYMAATLYTGTGAAQSIVNTVNGISFQPDLVWVKKRSAAASHGLIDSVRGAGIALTSNSTDAERNNGTGSGGDVIAFNSNGFNLGTNATGSATDSNLSAATYVGWQWKAGGTAVTNTNGTISSQVSANPTAGFSVVTYTGNGTAGATVGHGLSVAPNMIIAKSRSATGSWPTYTSMMGSSATLLLDTLDAAGNYQGAGYPRNPTSTLFELWFNSGGANINATGVTYVAYCFAAVAGYSAFGSYVGNGSTNGPFVYTGFRPRFFLAKISSGGTGGWHLIDTSRSPYNEVSVGLYPNFNNAESSDFASDILSNGLKMRNTQAELNQSGATYIYMAFAENPFKYSNAR
jgi:hypothetical protein